MERKIIMSSYYTESNGHICFSLIEEFDGETKQFKLETSVSHFGWENKSEIIIPENIDFVDNTVMMFMKLKELAKENGWKQRNIGTLISK